MECVRQRSKGYYYDNHESNKAEDRELTKKEKEFYIKKAKEVCYSGSFETRIKRCYGWN